MAEPQIYSPEYYQQIYDLEEKHWWYLGLRAIAFAVVRHSFGTSTAGRR